MKAQINTIQDPKRPAYQQISALTHSTTMQNKDFHQFSRNTSPLNDKP